MSAPKGENNFLRFGQVVIGPPGSGKTTYCQAMQEFLTHLGRKVVVVNMDPANDGLPYSCAVDISELVTLDDVMDGLKLGPNGGLLYCMEYVEANLDWLENNMKEHLGCYFLFDSPRAGGALHTPEFSEKYILAIGKVEFQGESIQPMHLTVHHAACRAPSCQHLLQDGPD